MVKRILPAAIAMSAGIITLATFFLPGAEFLRVVLVDWAIVVATFAMILGFLNVFSVHATHISRRKSGWGYSIVLLIAMIPVFVASGADGWSAWRSQQSVQMIAQKALASDGMVLIFNYVLIPIQSSLAALLPFLLAFAAYRTLRMRTATGKLGGILFVLSAVLMLLGQAAMVINLPALSQVREWILRVGAMAGMRGILLGVALGITATALRVLIGADRPTSD